MDFTAFAPLLKEGFLLYLKQKTKQKIQDEFFKDVYLKVDRTHKPNSGNVVDQKTITMIDEFEELIKTKYFVEVDNAENEQVVLNVYSDFVRAKDTKVQELGDVYKEVYGQFMP